MDFLRALDPKCLAELTAALFRELGFRADAIGPGTDGGIDVRLYPAQSDAAAVVVQCKAWGTLEIGAKSVTELVGAMARATVREGILCTTGNFTLEAIHLASANHVDLVSGKRLLAVTGTLTDEAQQRLLNVATRADDKVRLCPSCGIALACRGSGHRRFWRCTNFPLCNYTLVATSAAG